MTALKHLAHPQFTLKHLARVSEHGPGRRRLRVAGSGGRGPRRPSAQIPVIRVDVPSRCSGTRMELGGLGIGWLTALGRPSSTERSVDSYVPQPLLSTRANPGPAGPARTGAAHRRRSGRSDSDRAAPCASVSALYRLRAALNLNPACQGGTRARAPSTPPPNRRGGCSGGGEGASPTAHVSLVCSYARPRSARHPDCRALRCPAGNRGRRLVGPGQRREKVRVLPGRMGS